MASNRGEVTYYCSDCSKQESHPISCPLLVRISEANSRAISKAMLGAAFRIETAAPGVNRHSILHFILTGLKGLGFSSLLALSDSPSIVLNDIRKVSPQSKGTTMTTVPDHSLEVMNTEGSNAPCARRIF
jgi:hypothetical protein